MTAPSVYPFPAELAALPRDRAAVIEASAGTGKTYLIEHLVVDRLVRGDARIDEMLVVTFTERAAAELVRRIRALIRRVLRHERRRRRRRRRRTSGPSTPPRASGWRRRCARLDVAPISTIHAFCQRVLTEHAFASGRLLAQSQVESRTAFTAAFDEVIRSRLDGELGVAARRLAGARGATSPGWRRCSTRRAACAATGRRPTIPSASRAPRGRSRRARSRTRAPPSCARSATRRRQKAIAQRIETLHAACHALRRARRARAGCSPSSTTLVKATKDLFAYLLGPIAWPA